MDERRENIINYIREYQSKNMSFFPLFPSTKIPIVKHADFYNRLPTKKEIKEWLSTYLNPKFWEKIWNDGGTLKQRWIQALQAEFNKIGKSINEYKYKGEINIAVAGGFNRLSLIDIEDVSGIDMNEPPAKFFRNLGFVVVKTGKTYGYHLYCLSDWKENVKGENGEIRVKNQYVAAPPSKHPIGSYYELLTPLDLKEIPVSFIKKDVLKWVKAKEDSIEKKKATPTFLWSIIKDAAKSLPVEQGKRSDWTFALTTVAKTLLKNEKEAFKELMEIPIVQSKITRDKDWDIGRAFDWWYRYEWDEANSTSIYSLIDILKWVEKTTGSSLSINIEKNFKDYMEITREKGYGYNLDEKEIINEIVNVLDSCIERTEKQPGVETRNVRPDYVHTIAKGINNMFYFSSIEELDELYIYRNGVYKPCDFWLKKMLQHTWDKSELRELKPLNTNKINEIIDMIKRINYTPLDRFYESWRKYINVKNGLLDISDWTLKPHRPETLFLTQLDADWNPTVETGLWNEFLKDVVDEEYIPILQEFSGYCLLADCRFEKALAIVGPGRSGKSTFLEVIRAILGDENTTGFSIQQLENERFSRAELIGKLANIYNDLPYKRIDKSDVFKQLVSGDPIQVEKKYLQPFVARLTTKLIFSANQLPPTEDMSTAFFRRWIIILFPNSIANPDPLLKRRLIENEIVKSYVLRWMVEGLQRLMRNGGFSYNLTAEDIGEFYVEASDSVVSFIREHIVEDESGRIARSDLYKLYIEFCKKKGYPSLSTVQFNRRIRESVRVGERIRKGVRYWAGIKYVTGDEELEELEDIESKTLRF